MTDERKQEIILAFQSIYDGFIPTEEKPKLTMFGLVSGYNQLGHNIDKDDQGNLIVGGDWVINNCPEPLKSLAS